MCQKHLKRLTDYFSRFNWVDWLHVVAALLVVAFFISYAFHFEDVNEIVFGNEYWYIYAILTPVAAMAFVGCICQRKNIWLGVCRRCRLTEDQTEFLNDTRDTAPTGACDRQSRDLNDEEQIDMGSVTSGSYASAVEAQVETNHCEQSKPHVNIVDNSRRKSTTSFGGEVPGILPEVQKSPTNICSFGYEILEEPERRVTKTDNLVRQSSSSEIGTLPASVHPSPKICENENTEIIDQVQYQMNNLKYLQPTMTGENGIFYVAQEKENMDSYRRNSASQQESQLCRTAMKNLNNQLSSEFVKTSDSVMKIILGDQPQNNGHHQDKTFSTPTKRLIKVQPDTPTINARTEMLIKSTLSDVFDSPVRSATGPRDFRGYDFVD